MPKIELDYKAKRDLYEATKKMLTVYGTHVNEERAIPDIHDGLKPVQRMILWAMYKLGMWHSGGTKKSARIVGECFAAGTLVKTPKGDVPIETLEIGDLVCTSIGDKKVTQVFENPVAPMYELHLSNGKSVKLTYDQEVKVKVIDELVWKKASELKYWDEIVCNNYLYPHYKNQLMDTCYMYDLTQIEDQKSFDITVDDIHEFYAAGIVVKNCMGRYHPHGDLPIYSAMQTMVWLPEGMIHGEGNWGSITGDSAAAARYTECKLSKYAEEILLDKDYINVIPMVENFDGTEQVPVYLPAKLPNILINGGMGIGLGVRTSIPTFTLDSIRSIVNLALTGKTITPEMCASMLEFNFAYGAHVLSEAPDIYDMHKNGTGSIKLGCGIIANKKDLSFVIAGFTPSFDMEKTISKLREDEAVESAYDSSDKEGPKVEVKFNRMVSGYDFDRHVERVYNEYLTKSEFFQANITIRSLDTSGELPEVHVDFVEQAKVADIINMWVEWRVELEITYLNYLLGELGKDLHVQNILKLAVDKLDIIVQVLKAKVENLDEALAKKLNITVEDAKIILSRQVRSLSNLSKSEIEKKIVKLTGEIAEAKKNLSKPALCVKNKLANLKL